MSRAKCCFRVCQTSLSSRAPAEDRAPTPQWRSRLRRTTTPAIRSTLLRLTRPTRTSTNRLVCITSSCSSSSTSSKLAPAEFIRIPLWLVTTAPATGRCSAQRPEGRTSLRLLRLGIVFCTFVPESPPESLLPLLLCPIPEFSLAE